MTIKGFRSSLKALTSIINGTSFTDAEGYATIQDAGSSRKALDVHPIQYGVLSTGTLDGSIPASDNIKRILPVTGHSFIAGKSVVRFTSGPNIYEEYAVIAIIDANNVLIAGEMTNAPTASNAFQHLIPLTLSVDPVSGGLITTSSYLGSSESPVVADPAGYTVAPTTVKTLTATLRQVKVSNNSGNDLILTKNGTDQHVIPKGTNALAPLAISGAPGDTIGLRMVAGTGVTGTVYINFEG